MIASMVGGMGARGSAGHMTMNRLNEIIELCESIDCAPEDVKQVCTIIPDIPTYMSCKNIRFTEIDRGPSHAGGCTPRAHRTAGVSREA